MITENLQTAIDNISKGSLSFGVIGVPYIDDGLMEVWGVWYSPKEYFITHTFPDGGTIAYPCGMDADKTMATLHQMMGQRGIKLDKGTRDGIRDIGKRVRHHFGVEFQKFLQN